MLVNFAERRNRQSRRRGRGGVEEAARLPGSTNVSICQSGRRTCTQRTHFLPSPAPFSSTRHFREQNVRPHLRQLGKLTPPAPQTLHVTCLVRALASSRAASSGSIEATASVGSKGRRRFVVSCGDDATTRIGRLSFLNGSSSGLAGGAGAGAERSCSTGGRVVRGAEDIVQP